MQRRSGAGADSTFGGTSLTGAAGGVAGVSAAALMESSLAFTAESLRVVVSMAVVVSTAGDGTEAARGRGPPDRQAAPMMRATPNNESARLEIIVAESARRRPSPVIRPGLACWSCRDSIRTRHLS